ncbi:SCO family protein [Microbulbifer sp. SAOS-129_SWC]|uniref:SCO family protein n=1 Tax=Microbulbifer sp. SAOS-129_SWC TaxID=3145235 RepID=UPI003217211F
MRQFDQPWIRMCALALLALFSLFSLLLGGCGDRGWQTKDISGLMPPLEFKLTDENGRMVSAADYRGKPTLLFFGFTHCPKVCPTTLARLAGIARQLGDPEHKGAPADLQVLFVSVDPARDDPISLRQYTDAFGPEFIGLTGSKTALTALTRRYRVTYGYGDKDADGNYAVSHASAVFAFDRAGNAQLLIRSGDPTAAVTADLRRLLASG